jgi:C-terminal processing protease CtpA/Prc
MARRQPGVQLALFFFILTLLLAACNTQGTAKPPTAVPLPAKPQAPSGDVQTPAADPNEPVLIHGTIPFTSPFFINTIAEPFVLLEDEAGFIQRDREFEFPLAGQMIGPVEIIDEQTLSYTLPLPQEPQGTLIDLDNDGQDDPGVMVFAVAYWSNTWGGPFLEPRDGRGWSNAYTSATTDPDREDEIQGGILVAWAPDDTQGFPSGFGEDGMLFTEDDPIAPIPAGYTVVDLDSEPFRFYKEAEPEITLYEGEGAVNDYSEMAYDEAFDALFEKTRMEYPFTEEKGIDWDALNTSFSPRFEQARNDADFYRAIRDFTYAFPDAHVGVSFNFDVFVEEGGGGLGLVLTELSDGRIIATNVLPGFPAAEAGIEVGAEIITWDGQPVLEAVDDVLPYFGPYSTEHHRREGQVSYLTRMSLGKILTVTFQNPGEVERSIEMESAYEFDSLLLTIQDPIIDELALPIEGEVLDDIGLAYIRVSTFNGDYNLMARLWEHYIDALVQNGVPGLIIDIRNNGGGNGGLALDFASYFFDEEILLSQRSYYNERTEQFEYLDVPSRIEPAPQYYDGEIAILIGSDCVSACEGFAHALSYGGRSIVVGHTPTAGAYGEVGRGQYELPGDLSLQFPTGRPETPDGQLLIEGVGIVPDIVVPVTEESALGISDTLLEAAIQALFERLIP